MISVKLDGIVLKGFVQIRLQNGKKIQLKNGRNRIGNKSFYCQINLREVKKIKEQTSTWREKNPERVKQLDEEQREKNRDRINQRARERLEELKKHPRKYAMFCRKQRERNQQRLKKKELHNNEN